MQEAATHFSRSQSTMSELLERLEKRGLLQRIADERDRRRHLVWLTETGMSLLAAEQEVLSVPLLDAALGRLNPAQKSALFNGMKALVEAARSDDNFTIINTVNNDVSSTKGKKP